MGLLSQIIRPGDLARLSEHQLDILTSALDAEILQNAAVRKAVSAKVASLHKELTAAQGVTSKKGGGS